jgi:hypothetical protein
MLQRRFKSIKLHPIGTQPIVKSFKQNCITLAQNQQNRKAFNEITPTQASPRKPWTELRPRHHLRNRETASFEQCEHYQTTSATKD